jgi:hypothetical protein
VEVAASAERGLRAVAEWLRGNLLTLNISKTKLLCFHKTKASEPGGFRDIALHTCTSHGQQSTCSCSHIDRTPAVKYLGVVIDEKLNFKQHILLTTNRVRKLIYVFKNLRTSADKPLLKMVYISLCQSVLTYCITAWGGAAKTYMLLLERAQRAVLKIILKQRVRYPTLMVYKDMGVLSVRGVFVLHAVSRLHAALLRSPTHTESLQRCNFRTPVPPTKSAFAKRFGPFLHPFMYNKICKKLPLQDYTIRELKNKVQTWLKTLCYEEIENILRVIK